ncbi:MAG: LysM peptidoglycan-binding domain-containing protein [Verrucomicrobiales bacterium]|nr:LysM peptidoglycan-binding domain-containing protein [Verrucomicrobiales bacterium]
MSFRRAFRPVARAGLFLLLSAGLVRAQSVDPAVVGERLQRLTATVESLELTVASQRRQIDGLNSEIQRLREEAVNRGNQRPWGEDIKRLSDDVKRLADAISEVDRKRINDSEQVVKVLNELRKQLAVAAEAPKPAPRTDVEPRTSSSRGAAAREKDKDKDKEPQAEKAVSYVFKKGDSLSEVVNGFNAEAKKEGYQTVTIDQVMKFNKIADARRIREGSTIQLPVIPK